MGSVEDAPCALPFPSLNGSAGCRRRVCLEHLQMRISPGISLRRACKRCANSALTWSIAVANSGVEEYLCRISGPQGSSVFMQLMNARTALT